MKEIAPDKGYDHDPKYSNYRRYGPQSLCGIRKLYCFDIDWIEWRNHLPVGIVEVSRTFGAKAAEFVINAWRKRHEGREPTEEQKRALVAKAVYDSWCTRNEGLQREGCQYIALKLGVPLYFVIVDDPEPNSGSYEKAIFFVVRTDPAPFVHSDHWFNGKRGFVSHFIGKFDHVTYISEFLASLWRRYVEFQDQMGVDQKAVQDGVQLPTDR